MSRNVLIIVAPDNMMGIHGEQGRKLAQTLKEAGATRADLSEEPYTGRVLTKKEARIRRRHPDVWARSYMPTFNDYISAVANHIFHPVLGASEAHDLSAALKNPMLQLYANIAANLQRESPIHQPGKKSIRQDIALAFYLAHLGETSDKRPYDSAVLIGTSRIVRSVLGRMHAGKAMGKLDSGDVIVDLHAMRSLISAMYGGFDQPASKKLN